MKLALASLHVICLKDASFGGRSVGRVPVVTPLSSPLRGLDGSASDSLLVPFHRSAQTVVHFFFIKRL